MSTIVNEFSLIMWTLAMIFMLSWYKNRKKLGAGGVVWYCLFLACALFVLREIGHFSELPIIKVIRYVLGIWSATFFATGMHFVFWAYTAPDSEVSKKVPKCIIIGVIVIILALALLATTGREAENITILLTNVEHLVWVVVGLSVIYFTYMLRGKLPRRFVRVFFIFLMAFYCCTLWKILAGINLFGASVPYAIEETFEMMFGLLNAVAFYDLSGILREVV